MLVNFSFGVSRVLAEKNCSKANFSVNRDSNVDITVHYYPYYMFPIKMTLNLRYLWIHLKSVDPICRQGSPQVTDTRLHVNLFQNASFTLVNTL